MKPVFLSVCLALSSLMLITTPAAAKSPTKQFSSSQMAKTTIDSLEFKDVMRGLYAGKMTQVYVEDEELLKYPHIGLIDKSEDGYELLALMHPVISYQNQQGETRYLILIEKAPISEGNRLSGAFAESAPAELFIFKPLVNGQFQLVSRSKSELSFGGSYSQLGLDIEELKEYIRPLGREQMGAVFEVGVAHGGTFFSSWFGILLSENDYIKTVTIADATGMDPGGDGEMTSPLSYDFSSTFEVIEDGSEYYPIKVYYTGEMPDDNHRQKIRKVKNKAVTYYYHKAKNEYRKSK